MKAMSTIVSAAFGSEFSDRLHTFIKNIQKDNFRSAKRDVKHEERFASIEADVGFLAMMQVAMLKLLSDKGLAKDGELLERLLMADRLDGIEDGSLDVKKLRDVIGLQRGQSTKTIAARKEGTKRIMRSAKAAPAAKATPAKTSAKASSKPASAPKPAAKSKKSK